MIEANLKWLGNNSLHVFEIAKTQSMTIQFWQSLQNLDLQPRTIFFKMIPHTQKLWLLLCHIQSLREICWLIANLGNYLLRNFHRRSLNILDIIRTTFLRVEDVDLTTPTRKKPPYPMKNESKTAEHVKMPDNPTSVGW